MNGNPALLGGMLMSKPTWLNPAGVRPRRLFFAREIRASSRRREKRDRSRLKDWNGRSGVETAWPEQQHARTDRLQFGTDF